MFVPRDTSSTLPDSEIGLNEDNTMRLMDGEYLSGSSQSSLNGDDGEEMSDSGSLTARSHQTESLSVSDTMSVSSGEMEQEALSLYQDRRTSVEGNTPPPPEEDEIPLIPPEVGANEGNDTPEEQPEVPTLELPHLTTTTDDSTRVASTDTTTRNSDGTSNNSLDLEDVD